MRSAVGVMGVGGDRYRGGEYRVNLGGVCERGC